MLAPIRLSSRMIARSASRSSGEWSHGRPQSRPHEGDDPAGPRHAPPTRNFGELAHFAVAKAQRDLLRPADRQRRGARAHRTSSASAMSRRSSADLPPSVTASAAKRTATSSGMRSEISAIGRRPCRDVLHRWRKAYPALETLRTISFRVMVGGWDLRRKQRLGSAPTE